MKNRAVGRSDFIVIRCAEAVLAVLYKNIDDETGIHGNVGDAHELGKTGCCKGFRNYSGFRDRVVALACPCFGYMSNL